VLGDAKPKRDAKKVVKTEGGGWGGDDDLDISDDEPDMPVTKNARGSSSGADSYIAPQAGALPTSAWCAESSHAGDHFAAGSVETALQLLNRQIAAVNVTSIRPAALATFIGACAYLPGLPLLPSNRSFLIRDSGKASGKPMPMVSLKVTALLETLKQAYRSFTQGQFDECKDCITQILDTVPLVLASSRTETNDLKELIDVCREYLTAIRVKEQMGTATDDVTRTLELGAYFTHCNLQPAHLLLALKTAMATAFKSKVVLTTLGKSSS
jgi:coatomer protein complex subunit alpha (xenin)